MKKRRNLLFFPALLLFFWIICGENGILYTAKLALAATNPVNTLRYSLQTGASSAVPIELFPFGGNSDEGANPFEDFTLPEKETAQSSPSPSPAPLPDPDHPITELTYAPVINDVTYKRKNCYIKNVTKLPRSEVEAELLGELAFEVEKNSDRPQILIMHTHATESYQHHSELYYDPEYSCRTTDTNLNMVSVGKIMADKLNELGYNTLHDATLHDYPGYNGSYERSKATVEQYLKKYPSIKIVLDVHRDAIERADGTRIKPVVTINGKKCAQIMLISGADNGYMNMPRYKKNLRFASHFQNSMESLYPGITRPILFDYRNYNQQLTTGSVLIEVGGHANTLEEAHNSARLIAYSLGAMLDGQAE